MTTAFRGVRDGKKWLLGFSLFLREWEAALYDIWFDYGWDEDKPINGQ